ncbi:MAG: YqgE/AlgH family protein [Prosthecobacter sp.]|jgi:putative transcriptional regulator|uniref:YqgE/AlgH family protein n=1 Tax=Prosthecobacter sp. TaxID=1965333 RepID=UPI0019F8BB25|nr:YqgE/AlgH family protein [Prosthecobacter sp.]MBE2284238.1 YqgE/AlgH family protein [Prosthecobacter sp.]
MSSDTNNDSSSSLSGTLLLASPAMRDPNFSRSVVFMAAHNAKDGAFGYILNRPLEQRVADLLPDQDLGALGEVPVFMGGPVATDKLAFAALQWNRKRRTLRCQTHLSVADALHALSLGHDVRGFVGYSGWSGGQLENELEHRSWITTTARPLVLTVKAPTQLWGAILEEMGPVYKVMAKMPEDVSLN